MVKIVIQQLDNGLPLPSYAHEGDGGLDLYAADDLTLQPGQRAAVRTGIAIAIPNGFGGFVQPRSGRALSEGLGIVNTPGLVDAGYRGELMVITINFDPKTPIVIRRGERIAQLVIQRVEQVEMEIATELPPSERGTGGHGSSGR